MDTAQAERIRRIVRRVSWTHHHVRSSDADDLAQAILILVWRIFGELDPPAVWITRATHLQCLMMLRRRRRRHEREKEFARRRLLARTETSAAREQRLDLKIAFEELLGSPIGDELDPAGETLAEIATRHEVAPGTL